MSFNDRDYTRDSVIKQLSLIELHSKDGSALDAGCACIETKHLYAIEGLSEEGVGFALTDKEKAFYGKLADLARTLRKNIEVENWSLAQNPTHLSPCKKKLARCLEIHSPEECRASIKCAS